MSHHATLGVALAAAVALASPNAPVGAREVTVIPEAALHTAAELREHALDGSGAYAIVESLTTEVGPRLAGSKADARAVAWARAKFRELGYDKVYTEPVTFPKWVRRHERGEVLGAHAQPLALTALGYSVGTDGPLEAEVASFPDIDALQAAPAGSLAGKIALIDYRMERSRDGRGYGMGSRGRGAGPAAAAKKGAVAFLLRSAGTDSHRFPHTGVTRYEDGVAKIPAAALSNPDADQIQRLLERGPVRLRLDLDCGMDGEYTSANVIGEITGRERPDEVVVIGGHLDSWDLGTGAIDDGAGVALTMAAGKLIGDLPQAPKRTIRVIAFANEEQGLWGGRAYAERHAAEVVRHQIGAESDFGAGRIYAFNTGAPAQARAASAQIAEALAPLGIAHAPGQGGPGPDIGPLARRGMTWAWLAQDGTDYFDYHHTPDDTLDKIDPAALDQNAAAYAVFAWLAAEAEGDFGSAPKAAKPEEN